MAKKQGESVHVRLPLETLEEVDALARELGESRSEAVRALMAPSIRRRVNARAKGAA
jgi:metal-responsive CopG/Arc/MetJ family transcriptional regulator